MIPGRNLSVENNNKKYTCYGYYENETLNYNTRLAVDNNAMYIIITS